MKYYLFIILTTCLLLISCGKDEREEENPRVEIIDEDEDNTSSLLNDYYTYKLPIIFHVLYSNENDKAQYIPYSRLHDIINNVNELFKGGIYGSSEDINIKLILATVDEKGNKLPIPGVEYVKWTSDYPIAPYDFMNDQTGKYVKYIWDPNEYINVMVYQFATSGDNGSTTLGISHMPYAVKNDSALVGLETVNMSKLTKSNIEYPHCSSLNSLFINDESSRYKQSDKGKGGYTYVSADVNVTLAHELGHYLGLHHIYTERNSEPVDSCGDTDFCEDTPSYNRIEYQQYMNDYLHNSPKDKSVMRDLVRRHACDGKEFNSANIMDYSIGYGYKLSSDQKKRIRWVLYNSPFIPGPKKKNSGSRSVSTNEIVKLPIKVVR